MLIKAVLADVGVHMLHCRQFALQMQSRHVFLLLHGSFMGMRGRLAFYARAGLRSLRHCSFTQCVFAHF